MYSLSTNIHNFTWILKSFRSMTYNLFNDYEYNRTFKLILQSAAFCKQRYWPIFWMLVNIKCIIEQERKKRNKQNRIWECKINLFNGQNLLKCIHLTIQTITIQRKLMGNSLITELRGRPVDYWCVSRPGHLPRPEQPRFPLSRTRVLHPLHLTRFDPFDCCSPLVPTPCTFLLDSESSKWKCRCQKRGLWRCHSICYSRL